MKKYLIINGPNLNMVGTREPEKYGTKTLEEIKSYTQRKLSDKDVSLEWYQSNIEGEIVDRIQQFIKEDFEALIINPGAYSHTSVAIYDALKILTKPIIEVHLTNIHSREEFRQTLLTGKVASKIMCGLGQEAYFLAVLSDHLAEKKQ